MTWDVNQTSILHEINEHLQDEVKKRTIRSCLTCVKNETV